MKFGRPVAVYNFGMGDFTAEDELISQLFYGGRPRPQLTVVMDGYNDIQRIADPDFTFGAGIPIAFHAIRNSYPVHPTSAWLERRYAVADPVGLEEVLGNYRETLRRMAVLAKADGRDVLFAVQPVKFAFANFSECRTLPDKALSYIDRVAEYYTRVVANAKAAAESGASFADLHDTFADEPSACPFFCGQRPPELARPENLGRSLVASDTGSASLGTAKCMGGGEIGTLAP